MSGYYFTGDRSCNILWVLIVHIYPGNAKEEANEIYSVNSIEFKRATVRSSVQTKTLKIRSPIWKCHKGSCFRDGSGSWSKTLLTLVVLQQRRRGRQWRLTAAAAANRHWAVTGQRW
jgi:hypothetical protein